MTTICRSDPETWLRGAFATALRLTISGKPVPKPAPKVRRNGYAYYSPTFNEWFTAAKLQVGQQVGAPIINPLSVAVEVVGERPKNTILTHPRGDVDNFSKGILDALTKGGAWLDDALVRTLLITKRWADEGEDPDCNIWIGRATA
jgi:Holliday junction resolvase RusA-like endonuclease